MTSGQREWVLREFELFRDLAEEEVMLIGTAAPMSHLSAGQRLYSPDRPSEVLFILKQGRIRLFQIGAEGRTLTTAIIEAGQIFGEMAALGQRLEQTYAETLEPCVVCLMSRSDVDRLLLSDPRIARRVAEFLGTRVAELERRLGDTVLKHAPERIAALLVRLGAAAPDGRTIRLTHEQLADLAGSSRETVTKVLGELLNRRILHLHRGRIIIDDPHALGELSVQGFTVTTRGYSA